MAHTRVSLMNRDVAEIITRYWSEEHNIPLQLINAEYDEEKSQWVIGHATPIKK